MPNHARLAIDVTTFVPNPSATPTAPFCAIAGPRLVPKPGQGGHENAEGQVTVLADGTIVVRRDNLGSRPVKLEFELGPGQDLRPVAIVFRQVRGTGDPDGTLNFRSFEAGGHRLRIDNHCQHRGRRRNPDGTNQAPNWKYFIRVMQGSTAGWIDPGIENSDDMQA